MHEIPSGVVFDLNSPVDLKKLLVLGQLTEADYGAYSAIAQGLIMGVMDNNRADLLRQQYQDGLPVKTIHDIPQQPLPNAPIYKVPKPIMPPLPRKTIDDLPATILAGIFGLIPPKAKKGLLAAGATASFALGIYSLAGAITNDSATSRIGPPNSELQSALYIDHDLASNQNQSATVEDAANRPPIVEGWYTVQAGDTLYAIAMRTGLTVGQLVSANGLTNPNLIFPGQRLSLNPNAPDSPVTAGSNPQQPHGPGHMGHWDEVVAIFQSLQEP